MALSIDAIRIIVFGSLTFVIFALTVSTLTLILIPKEMLYGTTTVMTTTSSTCPCDNVFNNNTNYSIYSDYSVYDNYSSYSISNYIHLENYYYYIDCVNQSSDSYCFKDCSNCTDYTSFPVNWVSECVWNGSVLASNTYSC